MVLICCRYCGHVFKDSDIPKNYSYWIYDLELKKNIKIVSKYDFEICPSCSHALEYEVEKGIPQKLTTITKAYFGEDGIYFGFSKDELEKMKVIKNEI